MTEKAVLVDDIYNGARYRVLCDESTLFCEVLLNGNPVKFVDWCQSDLDVLAQMVAEIEVL